MGHSLSTEIDEHIIDVCTFLIRNRSIIISDLKKEFGEQISEAKAKHKGFARQAADIYIKDLLSQSIRNLYRGIEDVDAENVLMIADDEEVSILTNRIINDVITEC